MDITTFEVQPRDRTGKEAAAKLRAAGRIPGVAYGLGRETIHLAVPVDALEDVLRHSEGANVVLNLQIPGETHGKDVAAIIKEIQRDPVTRAPLSVDFQWISLAERITVEVPVHVTGTAPGVKNEGGVVQVLHHNVAISCLPTDIPEHVVASIEGLGIGDTVCARDLLLPEGVALELDADEAVVHIAPPISEAELEARADEAALEELVDLEAEEAKPSGKAASSGAAESDQGS